ncbi:MAG: hypothetical protein NTW62_01080 [Candidatus Nomurabacteria bacterium]|nr:hypothetical protein [Candidatus Nomurabacteria bacterium]
MKKIFKKDFVNKNLVKIIVSLILFMAIIIYSIFTYHNYRSMQNAVQTTLESINSAHNKSFSSINSDPFGVHLEKNEIIIFSGENYYTNNSLNEIFPIKNGASISNVVLNGISSNSGDISFQKITGIPNKTGNINITVGNKTKVININSIGLANMN